MSPRDDRGPAPSARQEILARVRAARSGADSPAGPGARAGSPPPSGATSLSGYRRSAPLPPGALLDLFAERCADYGATVTRTAPDAVADAVGSALARRAATRVVRAAGLPGAWQPTDLDWIDGDPLDPRRLDAVDAVVTGCAVAIAQTGTVVLDAGPDQGPRALTLLPDHHVCVVPSSLVVHLLPEAIGRLEPAVRAGRPLTLISGSSATSDIELERVAGVHGPRVPDVVLIDDGD